MLDFEVIFNCAKVLACVASCTTNLYCCDPNERVTEIVEPIGPATSAVIYLHGAGESGPISRKHLGEFLDFQKYQNTRFIFPTAQPRAIPAFPWNGQVVNVWFSISKLDIDGTFNTTDIKLSAGEIDKLIEQQVASGIPRHRICLLGFSSGGMMSLYYGYEYGKNLGCIGSMMSYLSNTCGLYKKLTSKPGSMRNISTPLYLCSGGLDPIIQSRWTDDTAKAFEKAGVPLTYIKQWGATHVINKELIDGLFQFIEKKIM